MDKVNKVQSQTGKSDSRNDFVRGPPPKNMALCVYGQHFTEDYKPAFSPPMCVSCFAEWNRAHHRAGAVARRRSWPEALPVCHWEGRSSVICLPCPLRRIPAQRHTQAPGTHVSKIKTSVKQCLLTFHTCLYCIYVYITVVIVFLFYSNYSCPVLYIIY